MRDERMIDERRIDARVEEMVRLLLDPIEFKRRVERWWWYRLGLMPGRVMRAVAYRTGRFYHFLLAPWRFLVYAVTCKRPTSHPKGDYRDD